MGAWGAGSFDNDGAMDWFMAYQDEGVSAIEDVFAELESLGTTDYIDSDVGSGAIAAAEVVAACHGRLLKTVVDFVMGPDTDTFAADLIKHRDAVLSEPDLVMRSRSALDRVVIEEYSELLELWSEAQPADNETFLAGVADLRQRLEAIK